MPDIPMPFASSLEDSAIPDAARVLDAVRTLAA
jgi:hypothetical protein